jgi:hypothetical protein
VTTAQSHPRRAKHTLPALLIATCLAMASIGAAAAARTSIPPSSSTSSQALHGAVAISAADHMLVSRAMSLAACRTRHPQRCNAERRAIHRAGDRLAAREQRQAARQRRRAAREGRVARLAHKNRRRSSSASTVTQAPQLPSSSTPTTPPPSTPPSSAASLTASPTGPTNTPASESSGATLSLPETPSPPATNKIIGTNDGAGWGPAAAQTILGGHIAWNRVEIGAETNTLAESLSDGFHNLAIVGNVNDGTPLSAVEPSSWAATVVSQLQANPGITIAEAGNEMFLKGNVANPVQYGKMYLAAVDAMKAAGIHTPLLFDMFGGYPTDNWTTRASYSLDTEGGGWLRVAVTAVPGLAAAILANGVSSHPYGALEENNIDSYGVKALAAQEAVAQAVLGATPTFYITEFGYSLSNCGEVDGACSQQEQAGKMRSAYKVFLADPHVAGIWVYQSHDDSSGEWGYMNSDNTTRPLFTVLSEFATEQGE